MRRTRAPTWRWAGALSALLCAIAAVRAAESPPTDWRASYRVRLGLTEADVPAAEVEATLKCEREESACPAAVEVDMAQDGFPGGYGSFVRCFQALLPEGGGEEAVSVPDGRYRLPVGRDGSASFRYRIVLTHDPSGWGPGPDEAPYRFEGGTFWTGRALFITAPRSRVEVSFSAPEGQKVSVSFEPIRGRPGSYTVPGESRLRDCFLVVGHYREEQLRVGKALVTLVLGGKLGDSMPVVNDAIRRFLGAAAGLFDGAPPGRILVVGNLGGPRGSLHGGGSGAT